MPHLSVIIYGVKNVLKICCDYIFPPDKISSQILNMSTKDFNELYSVLNKKERYFARVHLFHYKNKHIQRFIHMIKYEKNKTVVRLAAKLLSKKILELPTNLNTTLLCPVPQSKRRKNERGYNQCELVTTAIYKIIPELLYSPKFLQKIIHTKTQTKYTRDQRLENIANSIVVNSKVKNFNLENKTVIIVDDVYTTGATATEVVRAVQMHNPKHIYFITLAWA